MKIPIVLNKRLIALETVVEQLRKAHEDEPTKASPEMLARVLRLLPRQEHDAFDAWLTRLVAETGRNSFTLEELGHYDGALYEKVMLAIERLDSGMMRSEGLLKSDTGDPAETRE